MTIASVSPSPFYDVFISYGRADSQNFATKLCQQLTALGFGVWLDQHDIPLSVDFQAQIEEGIAKAHNFLFIIAPHAVNSPYCAQEITLALQWHKRIIPLLQLEQISRETWQTRQPQGTDAEWENYQAKALCHRFASSREHSRVAPRVGEGAVA
jgi:hypothetical protein